MEENLNNQQALPGDGTPLTHAVFSSDDEMMRFYLTFYRLMNPTIGLEQITDKKKLEDLENVFYKKAQAFAGLDKYKSISIKEVIKGFGMYMMNINISHAERLKNAAAVSDLMDCVLNTTKNIGLFKHLSRMNVIHLMNVKYLLKELKGKADEEKEGSVKLPEMP